MIKVDFLFYFQSIEKNYVCFQCFFRINLRKDNNKNCLDLHPLVVKLNVLKELGLLRIGVSKTVIFLITTSVQLPN